MAVTSAEERFTAELLVEIGEAATRFELDLNRLRIGEEVEDTLDRLSQQVNNLRLLASGCEHKLVPHALQRFNDYLRQVDEPTSHVLHDLTVYVDMLEALSRRDLDELGDAAEFVRSMPVFRPASLEDLAHLEIEILLVDGNRTRAGIVGRELRNCGYRVTTVKRSAEAIGHAAQLRPDLMIIAGSVDEISGPELAAMLAIPQATRDLKTAIISSHDRDHPSFRDLPERVRRIRQGEAFSEDLADTLAFFGLG